MARKLSAVLAATVNLSLRRLPRPDLVLASWRSGHQSPSPLGPLLAGLLGLPQATAVDELVVQDPGRAVVGRRLGRGEREELALPADKWIWRQRRREEGSQP